MVLTLLTVGLLSFAEAPKPAPVIPFTEVVVRNGKLVVLGKDFQATAHRFLVTPDGKHLHLVGTDDEPATLASRPDGPHTMMQVSGKRIVFSPSEGTVRVEGAGKIIVDKPNQNRHETPGRPRGAEHCLCRTAGQHSTRRRHRIAATIPLTSGP